MLASIVGNVDVPAAAVLIALIACLCIAITTMIGKRKSRIEMANELKLAEIRLANEREVNLTNARFSQDYRLKQLDQNLITSHKVEQSGVQQ